MTREVKLSRVEAVFEEVDYPADRETAAAEFEDVTLLADGERNLGALVSEVSGETFDSAEELRDEINSALPREAVGEPYQSEGEG